MLTIKNRKAVSRIFSRHPELIRPNARHISSVHYHINERAEYAARIAQCVENGLIGIVRSGMDCDCSRYVHSQVFKVENLFSFVRYEAEHRAWLDGPEHTSIVRLSEITPDDDYTRDLALEAYEDGHPWVVYT